MNGLTYLDKTTKLKSIAKKALDDGIIGKEMYDDLSSRIQNNEFRITIVGEFSSGKSTLIDALIGKDVLPHSTSETTATLTYIHSVECGHPKENKAEIFYSDGKTEIVDFSKLKEYVTAFSQTVDVFSSIEYVEIYVSIDNFDNNIVIVDTPGLNGTNHYEDRTLQEIAKADASVFVFSPSGIKATEQTFMKEELSKHQNSFFFVMNRIDDLHTSEGDSVEAKLQELAKEVSVRFFDGKQKVTNIYGISALKALAAKDTSIQKLYVDDQDCITDKDRDRLWAESRFDTFLANLKKYLVSEKENVFINSLASQLSFQFEECLRQIEQNLVANSPKEELPAAVIIKDEINTAKSRFNSYENGLEKNVNARMDDVEKNLRNELIAIVRAGEQRCKEVNRQIDAIRTIEEFYRVYGEDGSKSSAIVNNFYDRYFDDLKQTLTKEIISVRNDMLLEIRKLIPNISNLKKSCIDSVNIGQKTYSYKGSTTTFIAQAKVNECDQRIAMLRKKQSNAYQEKAKIDNKHHELGRKEQSLQSDLNNVNYRIYGLGVRPDAKLVEGTRQITVERSMLNPKRWFGSKYTTKKEKYSYYDYSAQTAYDSKRQRLDSEKSTLNSQLSAICTQIDNLPDMESELRIIARDIERQLKEKEHQLEEIKRAKEMQQKEEAAGRQAFLNSRKKALINTLHNILANEQSDLHLSLKNDAMRCLTELRGNLTAIVRSYFKTESENYIKQLNVMLENISSTIENKEIELRRNTLNVSKNKVNTLLTEVKNIII